MLVFDLKAAPVPKIMDSISGRGERFFSYFTVTRLYQTVPGGVSLRVKQPMHDDQSSPSSAMVKNNGALPPHSHMYSWCDHPLIKHRLKFTHTFTNNKIQNQY
jgi:hypothetical protein